MNTMTPLNFSPVANFFHGHDREKFGKFLNCPHNHSALHIIHEMGEKHQDGRVLAEFFKKSTRLTESVTDPIFRVLMQGCMDREEKIQDKSERKEFHRRAHAYREQLAAYLARPVLMPMAMAAPVASPAPVEDEDAAICTEEESKAIEEARRQDEEARRVAVLEKVLEDLQSQLTDTRAKFDQDDSKTTSPAEDDEKAHRFEPLIANIRETVEHMELLRRDIKIKQRGNSATETVALQLNEQIMTLYGSTIPFLLTLLSRNEVAPRKVEQFHRSFESQVNEIHQELEKLGRTR